MSSEALGWSGRLTASPSGCVFCAPRRRACTRTPMALRLHGLSGVGCSKSACSSVPLGSRDLLGAVVLFSLDRRHADVRIRTRVIAAFATFRIDVIGFPIAGRVVQQIAIVEFDNTRR